MKADKAAKRTPAGNWFSRLFRRGKPGGAKENAEEVVSALSVDERITILLLSACLHVLILTPFWFPPLSWPGPEIEPVTPPPTKVVAPSHPLTTRNRASRLERETLPKLDQAALQRMYRDRGRRINACLRCTLTKADFSGGHYRLSNLRYADMRAANMQEANFDGARLIGANLSRANMRNIRLQGALMTGADVRLADLSGARMLGVWIDNADFTGANLTGAQMREMDVVNGARFRDAILRDVDFRRSNLGRINFYGADLSGADLRGTRGLLQSQLDYACGDRHTQLPKGFTIAQCEG